MKRVLWRLSLVLAVCATVFVPVTRAGAAPASIQPGDSITSAGKGCTLGFAATGGGSTYFMTAAHCVDNTDDDVVLDDGTVFADVAAQGDLSELPATADDWALLKVRAEYVPLVEGEVRGIASTPNGFTSPTQTALGDVLRISGHGIPWYVDPITRENRIGVVISDDADVYTAIGMDTMGDSGGPIVHQATGRAFGLVSRGVFTLLGSEGPTVQGVLAKAADAGFTLTLLNA